MAYVANKRRARPTANELRQRIPGWGADLDQADRPSSPKEQFLPDATGAHWDFPDRQLEWAPRERSIEHEFLTPVFGSAQPLHGLSGVIRRFAYARYSEAHTAHWLLLIMADRVEAGGAHVRSLASRHPDNPLTQSGILSELHRHPISSRRKQGRVDNKHIWLDPLMVAGPWIVSGFLAARLLKRIRRAP